MFYDSPRVRVFAICVALTKKRGRRLHSEYVAAVMKALPDLTYYQIRTYVMFYMNEIYS